MHSCLHCRIGTGILRLVLAAGIFLPAPVGAKEPSTRGSLQSTTSQAAKQDAIDAIPLARIPAAQRRAVQQVLSDSSLYRRLPTGVIPCDPDMFTHLMRNPEMLAEIWRELGISRVDLRRIDANRFRLTDHAGTTARLSIVEQQCEPGAQNRIVMYVDGAYEGKPFKRAVRAQCVLLLRSGSFAETNGDDYVAARLDTFVRLDRTSIKLFAKAMHPWVGKTADANFMDTLNFVSNLSQAAAENPATITKLVLKLPRVSHRVQQEMLSIARRSADVASAKRVPSPRVARGGQ